MVSGGSVVVSVFVIVVVTCHQLSQVIHDVQKVSLTGKVKVVVETLVVVFVSVCEKDSV